METLSSRIASHPRDNCSVTFEKFGSKIGKNVTEEMRNKWTCKLRKYHLSTLPLKNTMRSVMLYFALCNAVVGIILNTINFIVFSRLWDFSCYYVYLSAIALGDMSNLLFNLLIGALRSVSANLDYFFVTVPALCYMHSFAVDFCSLLPVWLVCVATGNTLLTVLFPLHAHKYANVKRTRQVIALTLLGVSAWCTYKIPTGGLEVNSSFGYGKCRQIVYPTLVLMSSLLMSIVPAGISLAMNITIVLKIQQSRRQRKKMSQNDVTGKTNKDRRQSHMTRIVLLVSFAFIALVTPNRLLITSAAFIQQARDRALSSGDIESYEYYAKVDMDNHFARQFGDILYWLNFMNNFIIYIASDKRFYEQFSKIFCCGRLSLRPAASTTDVSSQRTVSVTNISTAEL